MTAVVKDDPVPDEPADESDEATPADAAVAEVTNIDLEVKWRDETFTIPRKTLTSARFLMAFKTNELHTLLFELIGPDAANKFIDQCKPGESLGDVANEFFEALNKVTGVGNSRASRRSSRSSTRR